MIGTKTERAAKGRALALGLLLAALMAASFLLTASPAYAKTLTVNSTADRGDQTPGDGKCFTGNVLVIGDECTLRAAIQESNADNNAPTVDKISFDIPSTGVNTISPASQLPAISEPVAINGYTQPGASVNTATTGTNAVLKIVLDGSIVGSSADGLVVTAPSSTVRGLVINNGFRIGALIDEATPSEAGRRLEGCFIGTDASGTAGRGNAIGAVIDDGAGNVIGGDTLAARNVISGNNGTGVFLTAAASGNRVQGNLIGTDKNGTVGVENVGNRTGIHIVGGSGNTIGGNGAAGNTIAFNRSHGIQVQEGIDPNLGIGNRILANSISNNAELGINLGADGATPNDGDNPATPQPDPDSDTGPNRLQNFPAIASATKFLDNTTTISGKLISRPATSFTIQFFSSPAADRSGFGEGETFLGETQVTTNRNGNRSFSFATGRRAVSEGEFVTATATRNTTGDTSEFSQARVVEGPVIGP